MASIERWPALPLEAWKPTYETLHMYSQVVGKIRLALSPMMNHWWQVPLYVTARGLTTSPIPFDRGTFELSFDFFDHDLKILTSDGATRRIPLGASVKEFYREVFSQLQALDIHVKIWPMAVEVTERIRLDQDTRHATCNPAQAQTFWRVLAGVDSVLKAFRGRFTGKSSPVQFFWGSFDLALSRFSGRRVPVQPGTDVISRYAFDEEEYSVGFWPGGMTWKGIPVDGAAFYAYTVPAPSGIERAAVPDRAFFHEGLGEHLLMYDDVRSSADPEGMILDFAQSTFDAGSTLGGWRDFTASWYRPTHRGPEGEAAPIHSPPSPA